MTTRMRLLVFAIVAALSWTATVAASGNGETAEPMTDTSMATDTMTDNDTMAEDMQAALETETAVFAGGCFWGVEGVFERLIGVLDVQSGYSGGEESTASYYTVTSGTTGHAESVEVVFDPSVIPYSTLLEVFFMVAHDPTQLNYQGPDHGTQYRSSIFFSSDEQKDEAQRYIKSLERARTFRESIVTQVVPLEEFYPAEQYHQDFIKNNPTYPYVVYWDLPKIEHLEREYPELIATN